MARKSRSSIETHGLQEFVGHLFESGATYEQIITQAQQERNTKVSRAALSRYHGTWASAEAQLRLAQQDYETIEKVMNANPGTDFAAAAIRVVLGKMVRRLANANESFESMPLDKVSWLLTKLARAQQTGQALGIQEKRLELVLSRVKAVAKDVTDTVKAQGLSDDTAAAIRQKILGVVPA